jgi:peptidoglycan hydrolase-like protein with peptidoglycan-binding domain
MKLQGRNLSQGLEGPDVQILQMELGLLGYQIRASELQEKVFGEDTFKAVVDFQRKRGFRSTGVVDAPLARRINEVVLTVKPPNFRSGRITHRDTSALGGPTVRL